MVVFKFESVKILICYEYIKNNSFINLGDGSHIRIVWSCGNAVTHNVNIPYYPLSKPPHKIEEILVICIFHFFFENDIKLT